MNASLRRRHRHAFAGLSVLLPIGLFAALAGRAPQASTTTLPPDPRGNPTRDLGSATAAANARVLTTGAGGTFTLARRGDKLLVVQRGEPVPDVLTYWTASDATHDQLPADATLLGAVGALPRSFPLPATTGRVLLFSLAHGEVLAQATVEGL